MFGKSKSAALIKETPSQAVARLSVDAIAGTLKMDIPSGIRLAKTYRDYTSNSAQRNEAIHEMVELLVSEHFDIAEKLCDALVAKIGK